MAIFSSSWSRTAVALEIQAVSTRGAVEDSEAWTWVFSFIEDELDFEHEESRCGGRRSGFRIEPA
jgi:hypothetical protein